MNSLVFDNGSYRTKPHLPSLFMRTFTTVAFYSRLLTIVFRSSSRAKRLRYDSTAWALSSLEVMRALEEVGVAFEITGIETFRTLETPCIFLANHMSTLETFVLPAIVQPFRETTFVVKQSLVDYPVFRHVMRSRNPITVGRTNAREDLKAVLDGGTGKLKTGVSIIIFPQTTRHLVFDPTSFNTIGIKLARRAGYPVVPVALKTDAWANGKLLKDFGKIDPGKTVHFAFGTALFVKDHGSEEHAAVIDFISSKLREWNR